MTTCSYGIEGGDYERAGSASRCLKELLKSLGVAPQAVRRLMVAAYEAEMNVVIHALRGTLSASVDHSEVRVEVCDQGPGIPDLALAMKEGFSTAPARARELGFGAGLGLPNIRKHADRFTLQSEVGRGTCVRFSVDFVPVTTLEPARNSLHLRGERCRQCLQCIHACPTQALRVHRSVPHLLAHLCIECTACIKQCPAGALAMEAPAQLPVANPAASLGLPPAFLFQFGRDVRPEHVLEAVCHLGFGAVHLLDAWERAHRQAVRAYAFARTRPGPVISSCCQAVLNLVETRFPSLLEEVAPFATPEQAAARDLGVAPLVLAVCPAQRSSLLACGLAEAQLLDPNLLREAIAPALPRAVHAPAGDPGRTPSVPLCAPGLLRVEGIRQVLRMLEELEDGHLAGLKLLELYACHQGCFGSGVFRGSNPALAAHRFRFMSSDRAVEAHAWPRVEPLRARAGLRLDPDMAAAMTRLSRIEQLSASLPGRDCGQCGAPCCRAFAEDVVLDRISRRSCVHASWSKGTTP